MAEDGRLSRRGVLLAGATGVLLGSIGTLAFFGRLNSKDVLAKSAPKITPETEIPDWRGFCMVPKELPAAAESQSQ